MYETVQPTLPQETLQPSLLQATVRPTPGIAPLPNGSPVPTVTAVIVVILLLVIVLGGVLAVILVKVMRKKQELEIKKLQATMIEDENVVYDEVQEAQLSTQIEMKENDAYQQHIMKASTRVSPHTENAVVYEEVRGGVTNPGAGCVMEENQAYGWHLQRGEAASEYEEI